MNFLIVISLAFFIIGTSYAYGYGEISASDFKIVNSLGDEIKSPVVGQQLNLQTSLKNTIDKNVDWAYIVQIINSNGEIVNLNFVTGSLAKNQTFTAASFWTPQSGGNYKIETFVWDNLRDIDPLTPESIFPIIVT